MEFIIFLMLLALQPNAAVLLLCVVLLAKRVKA